MNYLVDMLMGKVAPPKPVEAPKGKGNPHPDNGRANAAKRKQALDRYRAAIGEGWTRTQTIDSRLGRGRSCSLKQLTLYYNLGIIDRRPLGDKPYNRTTGYEWRWK